MGSLRGRALSHTALLGAALLCAVSSRGDSRRPVASTPPRDGLHREILASVGAARPFEPRLSGGLVHAPCDVVGPAGGGRLGTLHCRTPPEARDRRFRAWSELAGRVREADGPSRAVWQLLAPGGPVSLPSVVALLRRAAETHRDPSLDNDLAVALLLQSRDTGDPRLLVEALDRVERCLERQPGMPEARFNRAILLRELGLDSTAADAWKRYAELDPESGWGREAWRHARSSPRSPPHEDELASRLVSLATGDASAVGGAVRLSRRRTRELAFDELFGLWAAAHLAGEGGRARRLLTTLDAVGQALEEEGGDGTVRLGVSAIRQAELRGPTALRDLATAHVELAKARQLLRDSRYGDAVQPLLRARPTLGAAGSPFVSQVDESLAVATLTRNEYGAVQGHLDHLFARPQRRATPAFEARAWWLRGLLEIRTGLFEESLHSFTRSTEVYGAMGEPFLAGAARALAAESYRALGRDEEAWRWRFRAFRELDGEPSGYLHNLLLDSADAAREAGLGRAAARLQSLGLANARRMGSETRQVECLLWRARIWSDLGRPDLSRADLRAAEARATRLQDEKVRRRLLADLAAATAASLGSHRRREARDLLTRALETYVAIHFQLRLPDLYLQRARLDLALGDAAAAEADLRASVAAYERPGAGHVREAFQPEYHERAQEAYEALVRLLLEQGRTTEALAAAERARTAPADRLAAAGHDLRGDAPHGQALPAADAASLQADAARLPPGTVLIEYFVLPDSVAVWRVADGGIEHWRRPLAVAELRRRIEGLWAAWKQQDPRAEELSADLHRDLLQPALEGLEPGRLLVFVPDRTLAQVPFAALRDRRTGRVLLADFVVSETLSLHFYVHRRRPAAAGEPEGVVLVGDPQTGTDLPSLPGARREVEEIRALYPTARLLDGAAATRNEILAALPRARIFHFAGHAIRDDRNPWASYLPLAGQDGGPDRLYARDLLGLDLPHLRLAVLAACSSAAPRDERTLAVSGLTLALLSSGTQAVVANLQPLDDETARRLLPAFHRHYRESHNAPEALRAAILEQPNFLSWNVSSWAALVVWSHQYQQTQGVRRVA